jgi:hypothetical protein
VDVEDITGLAEVLCMSGDLENFSDEISDLFVKCFGQLSMQVGSVSTSHAPSVHFLTPPSMRWTI